MDARVEPTPEESRRLQRCINDLISLLALPAVWGDGDPSRIVRTLIDALLGMLHLDFVYVRFTGLPDEAPIEMVRLDRSRKPAAAEEEVGHAFRQWLEEEPESWPRSLKDPSGDTDISILPLKLGLSGESGVIVAGCRRVDFPDQTERLVLEVAANQAAMGLQGARRLAEQQRLAAEDRKRAEIHLAGEKHVLEMIASGRPLRNVLEELCRFFEQAAPDCFCGIYPIDGRSKKFPYGVAPTLPSSYTAPIEGLHINSDESPRGQSIGEKTQVISEDIGSDPRWMTAPCRAHVLRHGLCAVWSTPICSRKGAVVGTVCVYQKDPGRPSPHHQEVIAHVAHLASIAIERSQAEAELRRSETFLTEGQRISLTGSFSWHVDTDELTFSAQMLRTFEFDPDVALTFELISGRVHPEDRAMLAEKMERVRTGLETPEYEIRLMMADGRIKYMRVFGRIVRSEDGRVECLGAVQDITRRHLAEQARDRVRSELAHVSRVQSLGALTASIAHEVNQPLASIITNGETGLRWLDRPEPNFERVQQVLERVVHDARRAADIIDRIRTMASGGMSRKSETTLGEIIGECMGFLHHELQSRNVSVSLDLPADVRKVTADRTQLQQVIVNLAMNAVQALTRSGAPNRSIAIRTQQKDAETVCCIIEDSGPGIDAEHLPRLFDSFFTTKETGMGLGLPIAQSIIEAHDGCIRADNGSTLGGARFLFELPVSSPSED
jgi:signal transduction histidine kinase